MLSKISKKMNGIAFSLMINVTNQDIDFGIIWVSADVG